MGHSGHTRPWRTTRILCLLYVDFGSIVSSLEEEPFINRRRHFRHPGERGYDGMKEHKPAGKSKPTRQRRKRRIIIITRRIANKLRDVVVENTPKTTDEAPVVVVVDPTDVPHSTIPPSMHKETFPTHNTSTSTSTNANTSSSRNQNNENYSSYPRDSALPSMPSRSFFNYDSSFDSQFGPGYSVVSLDRNQEELVVEYANNAWIQQKPPPMIPPSLPVGNLTREMLKPCHSDTI